MADSMWFSSLAAILPRTQQEFQIEMSFAGLQTTYTLIGMIIGSIFFAIYAGTYGRKQTFLITFVISTCVGLAAAFSPSFPVLCICLAFVGIGIGGNIPVDASLFIESIASEKQYLLTFLSIFWSAASVLSTLLAWLLIPRFSCTEEVCASQDNRGWRYFLFSLGILSLLMLSVRLCTKRILETPRFLISKKRYKEAADLLHSLAKENQKTLEISARDFEDAGENQKPESSPWGKFKQNAHFLVGGPMLR
jgi:MFS family permease